MALQVQLASASWAVSVLWVGFRILGATTPHPTRTSEVVRVRPSPRRVDVGIVLPPARPGLMPVRHVRARGRGDVAGLYDAVAELVYRQWLESPECRVAEREDRLRND